MLKILTFLSVLISSNSFLLQISQSQLNKNKINTKNINMYYERNIDLDNHRITIISRSQTNIIVNNWINSSLTLNKIEDKTVIKKRDDEDIRFLKNLYDFKVFMSINRNTLNTVYFSWMPSILESRSQVIYLVAGKIANNQLYIYRIVQNPYFKQMLLVNSYDFFLDLYNFHKNSNSIKKINFEELHKYDNRYYLSWNVNIIDQID